MAEEIKQEQKPCCCGKGVSGMFKVILGLVLLVIGGYLLIGRMWWVYTWFLIKACAGPFFILSALVTFAISKE
ncbi:MAG: hypothetical protein HZC15_01290 [Candidatus Omnitrophica bacterium]|jgi:hypothetical protein|nr:hypothetical protein [Candidatus Omnitrophota bacterium]